VLDGPPLSPEEIAAAYTPSDEAALRSDEPRTRPEPKAVSSRDDAVAAMLSGNPEGARDFLTGFVGDHPQDVEARLALARAHSHVGQYAQALKVLETGGGKDTRLIQLRADLLHTTGRTAEAIKLLESQLKSSKSIELRGDLLSLLVATGRGEGAQAIDLRESLYDDYDAGKIKTASEQLAVAQAALSRGSKGAFHDANMVMGDAEGLAPVEKGSWVGDRVRLLRGSMFAEKYAAEDAVTTFGLILERDPWHPEALAGTARVHVDSLNFAAGSRFATEALQVNPDHPEAHAVLARVALIEGRREEARDRITKHVFAVNSQHVTGLAVMAGLALMESDDAAYAKWRDQALAANPRNGAFYQQLSDMLGFLHLYPESETILAEGSKRVPNDPYVTAARGLNLLRLGREKEAREALERAWKRDPFNERTKNVLELYENSIDQNYTLSKVGALTIRLPTEDSEFVEPVLAKSVRWSRDELDRAYGTKAGDLRLEFFARPDEFSIRTVGVPSLGAVAVCFGNVITLIGPYHGSHNIENVIRHEMGHVYAIKKSRGRVPRWFTEGLSEWESEQADPAWARESAELLQQARRAGKLRRLRELELAFIRAESPAMMEVAYSTAAYAVRFMGKTYGRPKLVTMLEQWGAGKSTEEIFVDVLGEKLTDVEAKFERWFFAELDAKVGGWHPTPDPDKADELDALFSRATEQLQSGDRTGAASSLEELIARGGDGFAPRMLLAKLAMGSSKPETARPHLEAARKHHRESIEPLQMLADLARKLDQPGDEAKALTEALAIDGESFEPAARLLMLAELEGDTKTAALALRRIQAAAPLHPMALAGATLAAKRAGKTKWAKQLLARTERAAESAGGPADTFVVVALAADAMGDDELTQKAATMAVKSGGLPTKALERLGTLGGVKAGRSGS
jgi:tetratricopeptide (TPR) repeat protein